MGDDGLANGIAVVSRPQDPFLVQGMALRRGRSDRQRFGSVGQLLNSGRGESVDVIVALRLGYGAAPAAARLGVAVAVVALDRHGVMKRALRVERGRVGLFGRAVAGAGATTGIVLRGAILV
jgi:hypothetical protein